MKLGCPCGYVISDTTDYLFFKAHFIPDQDWGALWEAIDDAIEHGGGGEAACMRVRNKIGEVSSPVYQCPECGRVFIDDQARQTHVFAPESDAAPRKLFGSRR